MGKQYQVDNATQPKVTEDEKDAILRLVRAAKGKPVAQTSAQVAWVYMNIGVSWTEIESSTVPDTGAVPFLRWAKRNTGSFYASYHSKYLPTRKAIDRESESRGGHVDLDEVDRVLAEALETSCGETE